MKNIKLPDEWRVENLQNLLEDKYAGEWGNEDINNDGVFVIRTTNFTNSGKIDFSNIVTRKIDQKIVEKKKLKYGDIILEKSGGSENQPVGRVVYFDQYEDNYMCNNFTHVLRINEKKAHSKYIIYFLLDIHKKGITEYFQNKTTGIRNLQMKRYLALDIILPPLEIQNKIVEVLEKAEKVIEKRKEANRLLDELVKSRFIEMFGDPINNPKGWEVKKLKDISTKILSGNTPKGGSEVYIDEGIMFFRSQNVWKNKLLLDDIVYIDKETHNRMLKSSLKNRDILMTKTGRINTENSSLGRAAMFIGEDDSANINGHVYLVRLQEGEVNEFVLFILTTNEYRDYIRSVCVGGIDKRQINKEHLEEFPIIYPPIELQNQFADFVKQNDKLKFEMEKSLKELENNFSSLMQRAFKGELFN